MRLFLLIPLTIPLLNVLYWIWAHKTLRGVRHARWWRLALALFVLFQLVQFGLLILSRATGVRVLPPAPLLSLAYVWHLVVLPLFMIGLGVYGLIRQPLWAALRLKRKKAGSPAEVPEAAPQHERALSRRDLLRIAAVSAPAVLTLVGTGRAVAQLDHFRIRRMELPLRALPRELDGLTIAHLSDVHVGKFTDEAVLRKMVERTNELHPDLVLMTGDLIDYSLRDLPNALDDLKRLDPRHGIYMCEGNHDLFESRSGFEQGVRESGIPLLINEQATVNIEGVPVEITGLRWERPGSEPDQTFGESIDAVAYSNAEAFRILLAHHPQAFDAATTRRIPLTLAGHTHGGQLMLSEEAGAGPVLFKYWSGVYRQGDSALVVSNGVGNWFPLRVNAPAEIIHITLRSAPA